VRKLGHRLPCKVCGASRDGLPQNAMKVAVCNACYPDYFKTNRPRQAVTLWLPNELKDRVDQAAAAHSVSVNEYIRTLVRNSLEHTGETNWVISTTHTEGA